MMTQRNIPFNIDDFVDKLVPIVSNPLGWERIGQCALARSRRVAIQTFMHGPLTSSQSGLGECFSSGNEEDVTRTGGAELEAFEALKIDMLRIVRTVDTINLFHLVIDPNDFGRSVENLFILSCLFHDGQCGFHINEDEVPIVSACTPPSQRELEQRCDRRQMVFEFDMPTWRRAIDVFEITEPVMPRLSVHHD